MQARAIPLEQVIDDVVNMGFSRHEVSQSCCTLTPVTCLTGTTIAKDTGGGTEASPSVSLLCLPASSLCLMTRKRVADECSLSPSVACCLLMISSVQRPKTSLICFAGQGRHPAAARQWPECGLECCT